MVDRHRVESFGSELACWSHTLRGRGGKKKGRRGCLRLYLTAAANAATAGDVPRLFGDEVCFSSPNYSVLSLTYYLIRQFMTFTDLLHLYLISQ